MSKQVTFSSTNQIKETPRNRTIEIKQRSKNLIWLTKAKLKKRFPDGIQPYIEEKARAEAELELMVHKTISYREMVNLEKYIADISDEIVRFENLHFIIKNPNDYIESLDEYRRDSGKIESKKQKKMNISIRSSSPTSRNTTANTPTNRIHVNITKKSKSKIGGKFKKVYRRTCRRKI